MPVSARRAFPPVASVACTSTANDSPAGRFMAFAPTSGPTASFMEGPFSSVWSNVNNEATPFPDTFDATTFEDNGMGLSWPISLAGKGPTGAPGGNRRL